MPLATPARSRVLTLAPARAGLLLALAASFPGAAAWADDAAASEVMPLAAESLLLDVARAGDRLVAVGERGHVLYSDDGGAGWTQVVVPTRTTLTAVHFRTPSLGWAAGHEAVILRTEDAGVTWTPVHERPGEDLPLLDIWFGSDERGLAVGAYGTLLTTDDSGRTWSDAGVTLAGETDGPAEGDGGDEFADAFGPTDVHLNRLTEAPDGTLYAAGEAGHLLRSDDGGETWTSLPSPYEGSFFAVHAGPGGAVLAAGLRGHLFRSADRGETWTELESGTEALLTGIVPLADGRLVVHGLAGTLVVLDADGSLERMVELPGREGIAAALVARDGGLLLAGDFGTLRVSGNLEPLPPAR